MDATTSFNAHVFPNTLKEIYESHVWYTGNVPLQWVSPERFEEFVKSIQDGDTRQLTITKRVDGYVSLDIGDEVSMYGLMFKVHGKKYDVDREDLVYYLEY